MEIQNIERRNSEYALFESQREPDSQRHKLLDANQSMLNVREYIWVVNGWWRLIVIKKAMQDVAAKLECCEIHEKIWVFQEMFLIVNMLDEIPMHYAMTHEIWRHY